MVLPDICLRNSVRVSSYRSDEIKTGLCGKLDPTVSSSWSSLPCDNNRETPSHLIICARNPRTSLILNVSRSVTTNNG